MLVAIMLALAAAQDTAPLPRLELGQVYRAATAQNPRADAARALAAAARARVLPAKLPPDPQLQLGFMNYALPALAPMEVIGMRQLQLMQVIPVAGKLGLSGRVAAAQADAAADRARDVQWDVRRQVATAFYDLYATDRALEVARRTLRLLVDIHAIAEAMYRVGEGRQADVLRAQVAIARMAEDTVRMATMRSGIAATLNALLDRPPDAAVASPVLPRFPDAVFTLEEAVSQSQGGRSLVRAAERDVDAAGARTRLAGRERWPDLTVGVQYGQRGSAMGVERMGSLMLGATIPVFASSRQGRMREEAAAMRLMAEAESREMRAETRGEVAKAYADLTRARNLERLYRGTILPQAEAAAVSALAAYRVGSVNFMTLLDDRMTVNRYEQELTALQGEEGKSWAELEMLLGRELFDPDTRVQEPGRPGRNDD